MCPYCRGREVALAPVSGRGTIVAFSVNHQQWLPTFPPPYVVAIVAIDEDDGARLMTNIVNCPPDEVAIGQRVRVLFEQHDDVWLPLFEPDPDRAGDPGPLPAPRDYKAALRTMASPAKFEDKVAITGVGQSKVGRRLMVDPVSLTVDAALRAVEDAGLTLDEIDGICSYPGPVFVETDSPRTTKGRTDGARADPSPLGAPDRPGPDGRTWTPATGRADGRSGRRVPRRV
jgi:hypothetical protein